MKTIPFKGEEITIGSGNVYADLGLPDAEQMQIKAGLAFQIQKAIEARDLTQAQAAEIMAIPRPKVSNILRGKFREISEKALMDCLTRLGYDVQIVVKPVGKKTKVGHLSVALAA